MVSQGGHEPRHGRQLLVHLRLQSLINPVRQFFLFVRQLHGRQARSLLDHRSVPGKVEPNLPPCCEPTSKRTDFPPTFEMPARQAGQEVFIVDPIF
jgi:hypothetical protein